MPESSLYTAVRCLREAVASLPDSITTGHQSGVLYRNFKTKPSAIKGDPWGRTNQAYTRCFSQDPKKKTNPVENICRGPYGMDAVVAYLEEFTTLDGTPSTTLFLVEQLVKQLTDLVNDRQVHILACSDA